MIERKNFFEMDSEYDDISSFRVVKTSDLVLSCKVDLYDMSPSFESLIQGKNEEKGEYGYLLAIKRIDRRATKKQDQIPFRLLVKEIAGMNVLVNENISDFFKVKIREDNAIRFVFKKSINLYAFNVKFRFKFDFNTVERIILMRRDLLKKEGPKKLIMKEVILEKDQETPKKEDKTKKDFVVAVRTDLIRNYDTKNKNSGGNSPQAGIGMFAALSASDSSFEEFVNSYQAMQRKCFEWDDELLLHWFKQIPVFVRDQRDQKVISLYTHLENTKLLETFQEFAKFCSRPFLNLRDLIVGVDDNDNNEDDNDNERQQMNELEIEEFEDLRREFEIFRKDETFVTRLEHHFKILNFMEYEYNPSFYVVLKKRLHTVLSKTTGKVLDGNGFVAFIEDTVIFNFQTSWSVRALETKVAFNLLFGVTLKEYVTELENLFKQYNHNHGDLTNIEALKMFSRMSIGFPLEEVSVNAFVYKSLWCLDEKYEKLKKRKKELFIKSSSSSEDDEDEDDIKNIGDAIRKKYTLKLDQLDEELMNLPLDEEKYDEEKSKRIQQEMELVKEQMRREEKTAKAERKKERALLIKQLEDLGRQRNEIRKNMKKRVKDVSWEFYSVHTGPFFTRMNLLIQQKAENILSGKDDVKNNNNIKKKKQQQQHDDDDDDDFYDEKFRTISVSTKLVISRRTDRAPKLLQKFYLKLYKGLSLYHDLDHIKLGFSHSGIIFCNMLCQWFQNEVVVCEDIRGSSKFNAKYEEIACIDCQSLEFVKAQNFFTFASNLAKFIVDANTNWCYSSIGIRALQKKFVMNCQEFSFRLLENMGLSNLFYPVVNQFMDELLDLNCQTKKKSKKKKKKKKNKEEEDNVCYRYFRIPKELPESLRNEIETLFIKKQQLQMMDSLRLRMRKQKKKKKKDKKKEQLPKMMFFWSHKQLDLFVQKCIDFCPGGSFELEYPGCHQLLKGFDRAFWMMKIHRERVDDRYEPLEDINGVVKCPFQGQHKHRILSDEESVEGGSFSEKKKKEEEKEEEVEGEDDDEEGEGVIDNYHVLEEGLVASAPTTPVIGEVIEINIVGEEVIEIT